MSSRNYVQIMKLSGNGLTPCFVQGTELLSRVRVQHANVRLYRKDLKKRIINRAMKTLTFAFTHSHVRTRLARRSIELFAVRKDIAYYSNNSDGVGFVAVSEARLRPAVKVGRSRFRSFETTRKKEKNPWGVRVTFCGEGAAVRESSSRYRTSCDLLGVKRPMSR